MGGELFVWDWPTQTDDQATVQVPVKLMQMLGKMWEQIREDQESVENGPSTSSAHASLDKGFDKSYHDFDQVSLASTCLLPSSNLSSPQCSTPASSPGSSTRSIGSPDRYCSLSPADKAQLIQDLKDALCTSPQAKITTSSPVLRSRAWQGASVPVAPSPRQVTLPRPHR